MIAKQKVLLVVLDGLGAAPKNKGNAVVLANPTNLSSLWSNNPHTYLLASGEAVGLPKHVKGNSEVGHQNLGSGQVVNQNLPRIDKAIQTGFFFKSKSLYNSLSHARNHKGNIHILGLLSNGSVHSHINHFISLLKYYSQNNFEGKVYFHIFTDGRDTPTEKAKEFLDKLQFHINQNGMGQIATICGRRFGMDRNRSWDRTKIAYDLITKGVGTIFNNYTEAINASYSEGLTDEFIKPCVIEKTEVKSGDSIIHMNFRSDRALQLTQAFIEKDFKYFQRPLLHNIFFAGMVEYRKDFPSNVLVPKQYISLPLGRIISSNGLKQLRIAESEKFPHVTYFFNGGASVRFEQEDRIEIPSPNVSLYDEKPEMSAEKLTNVLINRINNNAYDFVLVNFANPDMVAHTGNLEASIKAVQTVDHYVMDLIRVFTSKGGAVIITADHGNAEELINLDTGEMDTEHSLNPVPFILIGTKIPPQTLPYGSLKDVAPTVLQLLGISQPIEMAGKSLLGINQNF
jgi:2,3-bisphosphoglycerate-independent phosphoglycerate mutase